MARISTGKNSKQDYSTPGDLFWKIHKHFPCSFDLAATEANKKCLGWFGPGSPIAEDALNDVWPVVGWLWLNPPYSDIGPWYRKCAESMETGCKIVSLVPMDAANWFTDYVPGRAGIWHLKGRVKFDGAEQSGAKDSCLHIWHPHYIGQYRIWDWKRDKFII